MDSEARHDDVFAAAKAAVTPSVVEDLVPGGTWKGGEYWVCSPLRPDQRPNSFHISDKGEWYDHAVGEGGSFVDLASGVWAVSPLEAAMRLVGDEFIHEATPVATTTPRKERRWSAVCPVPPEATGKLLPLVKSKWYTERYGTVKETYLYRDVQGRVIYARVRFHPLEGGKNVIPFSWGNDSRWHAGAPSLKKLPLYGLAELSEHPELPVVVVEGERCVAAGRKATQDYLFVTFGGGSKAVHKHDFTPLEDRQVIIWPDADGQRDSSGKELPWERQPGTQAARAVQGRLPQGRVLDVRKFATRKSGYDIVDFLEEDAKELGEFLSEPEPAIESKPPATKEKTDSPPAPPNNPFYIPLGWDENGYYFLRRSTRTLHMISAGEFTSSKILELTPLEYWAAQGYITRSGAIRVDRAQRALVEESIAVGPFSRERIRGSGVWRDGSDVVINTGRELLGPSGQSVPLSQVTGRYAYIYARSSFSSLAEETASAAEGKTLADLFRAQGFTDDRMGDLLLGWALIAPFAGALKWRPHMWLTARRGVGKSYVIENLITPLLGGFVHQGCATDTAAGLYRRLNGQAIPVVIDEAYGDKMSKNATEDFGKILTLARNSSMDTSASRTIARGSKGGTVEFVVRSMFLFSSISSLSGGAGVDSRIAHVELDPGVDRVKKYTRTRHVLPIIRRASAFRRRIFALLPQLLKEIEIMEELLLEAVGDARTAQQYAAILVASYRVRSDRPISRDNQEALDLVEEMLTLVREVAAEECSDEDGVIHTILQHPLTTDHNTRRTISELLVEVHNFLREPKISPSHAGPASPPPPQEDLLLQRAGIRLWRGRNDGQLWVGFDRQSTTITNILSHSNYPADRYGNYLKRNNLCKNKYGKSVRMAGLSRRAICFEWATFSKKYMQLSAHDDPPTPPPSEKIRKNTSTVAEVFKGSVTDPSKRRGGPVHGPSPPKPIQFEFRKSPENQQEEDRLLSMIFSNVV